MLFSAHPRSGHARNALIFFPEGDHTLAFASQVPNGAWGLRQRAGLSCDRANKEFSAEVRWEESTRSLLVRIDGKPCLDVKLGELDTLNGPWGFGVAGRSKQVRIWEVLLKADRPTK